MSDYPDENEEFELMYGDDLDLIRSQPSQPARNKTVHTINENTAINSRKRTVNELFGDIDDIEDDVHSYKKEIQLPKPKKLKKDNDDNIEKLALIEHILELRKEAQENLNCITSSRLEKNRFADCIRDSISLRVPQYPFTVATSNDGERLYIRTCSDIYWEKAIKNISSTSGRDGPLGRNFEDIWDEAQQLIAKELNKEDDLLSQDIPTTEGNLWVETYKPTKYMDLLSDEATNRMLLRWIKSWDRIVFNRRNKQSANLNQYQRNVLEVEADHRPKYKLVLLAGPPGLGKTTLAHLVALHAGYKPMEVNASDDRTVDCFKRVLDNANTMSSVLDSERRPNCVILDEIDGAPANSIDYLCKYVKGSIREKSKKPKTNIKKDGADDEAKKGNKILKRPIIAICNDAYVPALRTLRQMALVLHVPTITTGRLTQRLVEISGKEDVNINQNVLLALAEKSNCDIRNCLSMLQFLKVQSISKNVTNSVTLDQILKVTHSKDVNKGLFQVWSDIFHLQRNRDKTLPTPSERSNKIQQSANCFDYDKLAAGIFENYVRLNSVRDNLSSVQKALDWFTWTDVLNSKMLHLQNYQLGTYLTWGFVQWHFLFGNLPHSINHRVFPKASPNMNQLKGVNHGKIQARDDGNKIVFPMASSEARNQAHKVDAMLTDWLNHMSMQTRLYVTKSNLVLDILPMLSIIINPSLRSVHLNLYTKREKDELTGVVCTMIDYGLNYVQERSLDGTYAFVLDPNIDDLSTFSTSSNTPKTISYSNRQLIAREIDCEKMRRLEIIKHSKPLQSKGKVPLQIPSLTQLTPKIKNTKKHEKTKTFFTFLKTKDDANTNKSNKGGFRGSGIYFQFKEGHTNAVKKTIKISDLLHI